nr:hypothetical protein Iba_chr06aCG8660 [Ipomoea batatas]
MEDMRWLVRQSRVASKEPTGDGCHPLLQRRSSILASTILTLHTHSHQISITCNLATFPLHPRNQITSSLCTTFHYITAGGPASLGLVARRTRGLRRLARCEWLACWADLVAAPAARLLLACSRVLAVRCRWGEETKKSGDGVESESVDDEVESKSRISHKSESTVLNHRRQCRRSRRLDITAFCSLDSQSLRKVVTAWGQIHNLTTRKLLTCRNCSPSKLGS